MARNFWNFNEITEALEDVRKHVKLEHWAHAIREIRDLSHSRDETLARLGAGLVGALDDAAYEEVGPEVPEKFMQAIEKYIANFDKPSPYHRDYVKRAAVRVAHRYMFPSSFGIGDPVWVEMQGQRIAGNVRAATFTSGKVRYAVQVTEPDLTTLHNLDSVFVQAREGSRVDFDFDNFS